VRDVCTQIRQWRDAYGDAESLCVNINFSSRQLMQAELAGRLVETLSERGLEPRHIVVEITESTVIDDFSRAADVVRQLQRLGIRVVLDDFGTGYSSLACLHELPICGLKLDPTFASGARKRREILRAVVALARNLGLTVTAEGIESAEQLDRVRALGCDFAQGYLFARPLDAEAATRLVETQRRLGRPEPESRISRGVLESAGLRQP
jgi:EAL domain-containing protein (putative c-di-GMP-specific phosphodiesterase class I)